MSLKKHGYIFGLIQARRAQLGLAKNIEVDETLATTLRSYFVEGENPCQWVKMSYTMLEACLTKKAAELKISRLFRNADKIKASDDSDESNEPQFRKFLLEAFLNPVIDQALLIQPRAATPTVTNSEAVPLLASGSIDESEDELTYQDQIYAIIETELDVQSPQVGRYKPHHNHSYSNDGNLSKINSPIQTDDFEIVANNAALIAPLDSSRNRTEYHMEQIKLFLQAQVEQGEDDGRITQQGETIFVGALRTISTISNTARLVDLYRGDDPNASRGSLGLVSGIAQTVLSAGLFLMYLVQWVHSYYRHYKKHGPQISIPVQSNDPLQVATENTNPFKKLISKILNIKVVSIVLGQFKYIGDKLSPDIAKEFLLGAIYFTLGIITIAVTTNVISLIFAGLGLFDSGWDLIQNLRGRYRISQDTAANEAKILRLRNEITTLEGQFKQVAAALSNELIQPSSKQNPALQASMQKDLEKLRSIHTETLGAKCEAEHQDLQFFIEAKRRRASFALFRQITRVVLSLAGLAAAIVIFCATPASIAMAAGIIVVGIATFVSAAIFIAHTVQRQKVAEHIKKQQFSLHHIDNPLHKKDLSPANDLTNNAAMTANLMPPAKSDVPSSAPEGIKTQRVIRTVEPIPRKGSLAKFSVHVELPSFAIQAAASGTSPGKAFTL
jgi:hypothetical protein